MDEQRGTILLRKPFYDSREITLDSVLGCGATQSETYEVVARGVVDAVLEGYNGTVLAYGQTGTGKTYTMNGPPLAANSAMSRRQDLRERSPMCSAEPPCWLRRE